MASIWFRSALVLLTALASGAAQAASERTRMTVEGADLQFFPEVAAAMESLAAHSPAEPMPAVSLSCSAHRASATFSGLSASSAWGCSSTKQAMDTIAETASVCREIEDPIGYFSSLPVQPIDESQMGNLESALRFFAPAVVRMDDADALKKNSYAAPLRSILVKIRLDSLRRRLDARTTALSSLQAELAKANGCVTGDEASRASGTALAAAMLTEIGSLRGELDQIEKAGLAQAQQDAVAITSAGRKRATLPYPSLTDSERRLLSFSLSAFLWRARGGGIFFEPEGTTHRRMAFTLLPMREIARLNGGDRAAELGTALWWGLLAPWGHIHDYGRIDGDKWTDYAAMKVRGQTQVARVITGLNWLGYDSKAASDAGDMMAHCYWYGWERLADVKMGMNLTAQPYSAVAGVATNWGEFCTGATMGVALSEALLAGY